MTSAAGPLIVAGLPRSATSWTANVLAAGAAVPLLHEPDNEKEFAAALVAKRSLGRFPVLRPGEHAPGYEALWRSALSGSFATESSMRQRVARKLWRTESADRREQALLGRPSLRGRAATALTGASDSGWRDPGSGPSSLVVKTVHAALALEWVAATAPAARVLVVLRHPGNVLSSWRSMGLPDQDRALDRQPAVHEEYLQRWGVRSPGPEPLQRAAWQLCLLTAALVEAVERHPEWAVVHHEDLCRAPLDRFREVAMHVGVPFGAEGARFLAASDQDGTGYDIRRRATELPDRWRSRLDGDAVSALVRWTEQFPGLERWTTDLRSAAPSADKR